MSIRVENLVNRLNQELPLEFKAKLGGSMVLKGLKLINREPEDVDIIITHSFLFDKDDFSRVYSTIKKLFPLQEIQDMKSSCSYENVPQEKYRFNLKVHELAYAFGNRVRSINFLVQEDYIAEDHYSSLVLFDIPCVDITSILTAKRTYNRPKDIMDFHEMQKLMFF